MKVLHGAKQLKEEEIKDRILTHVKKTVPMFRKQATDRVVVWSSPTAQKDHHVVLRSDIGTGTSTICNL